MYTPNTHTHRYWNRQCECMPRERLEEIQTRRLRETVSRVYENVPFYKRALDAKGIRPQDITSLADLAALPFTTKDDLRDNYPFGLFAVPMSEVVRIHASSGTTGRPTVVGYTKDDIDTWAEVMARTLVCAGTSRNDVVQVSYGYGLFTGGLGVHYGAELVGATVIPMSGGNTKRQVTLMRDFQTTILASTPSYAIFMAETMADMGIARDELKIRAGVFGAEPWSDNMRREIEAKLGIMAIDIYGLSEVIGPGVASECPEQNGLHVFEDHFIPEIIDPDTGRPLPPGERGELVFTTITKQAFPLIRYRTRDISSLTYEPCPCGRTGARMSKVMGRTDDMLVVRGVNVFPSQIETVLLEMGHTEPHYLLVVDREKGLDDLEVRVEVSEGTPIHEIKQLENLERTIKQAVETVLGISVNVKLVEPRSIQRSEGKAKRVIDRREL